MRTTKPLTVTALAVVSLATAIAVPVGAAAAAAGPEGGSAADVQRMRDAMPPAMQRLHDRMMSGPAAGGMQQMMSSPAAAGMQEMMSPGAATPR